MTPQDDNAIIVKFEPVNVRDDFEYAFKMFSKALDAVLPNKEADPYISDFNYLSKKRYLIRNAYEGVGISLRVEGKKVERLIDKHIRSLDIEDLIPEREITYENFLGFVTKFKIVLIASSPVREDKQKIGELLKKPWNPYVRRHSSLTDKSKILKEHTLRQYAGWSTNSNMPQKYLHYFGNEASESLLEAYGIVTKDQKLSDALRSKQYPNCNEPNKPDSKFCAHENGIDIRRVH